MTTTSAPGALRPLLAAALPAEADATDSIATGHAAPRPDSGRLCLSMLEGREGAAARGRQ